MKKLRVAVQWCVAVSMLVCLTFYESAADDRYELILFEGVPTVQVASRRAETITEAPAILSVITSEDIRRMPYENLVDIIRTVPGVSESLSFFGFTSFSYRGIMETNYNNRTLLLINGHPIREVTQAQYYLETIPVNMIERIEIIRGPGSVMYGTNAFAGVIDITTKSGYDVSDASARVGSRSHLGGDFMFGRVLGEVSFIIGGMYKNDEGVAILG